MPVIHKYELPTEEGKFSLLVPKHSSILKVGRQNNSAELWATHDPKNASDLIECKFQAVYTGHEAELAKAIFLDTVVFDQNGDHLVVHYFLLPK